MGPNPTESSVRPLGEATRLSKNVVGACLRSAFIEALYDDCTEMLPPDLDAAPPATETLPLAAE